MTYAQFTAAAIAHDGVAITGGDPGALLEAWRHTGMLGALTEISRNRSTRFLIEFGDDDAGPLGVQRPGIRLADAAPGPGDDSDAVGETLGHQASSMVVVR